LDLRPWHTARSRVNPLPGFDAGFAPNWYQSDRVPGKAPPMMIADNDRVAWLKESVRQIPRCAPASILSSQQVCSI
jgi:hypothetical protein